MLLQAQKSSLLIVDVQEKLFPFVQQAKQLQQNASWMIQVAQAVSVPIVVSEQYPKGLGSTIEPLRELLNDYQPQAKVHFSCAADEHCLQQINALNREQVVILGIEAHVCVLQTAIELLDQGKQVFVLADTISSRDAMNVEYAIERMRAAGVQIITHEMAFFEWLHQAGTLRFKELSTQFIKDLL